MQNRSGQQADIPPTPYQLIGPSEDGTICDLLEGMTERDSRQRLQALIAAWLRMENLVVLTGSGTSVNVGGKTIDNLESSVLDVLNSLPNVPDRVKALNQVRINTHETEDSTSRIGFEEWLTYIVNGHYIGSRSNSPFTGVKWHERNASPTQDELTWFIEWVQSAIFAECSLVLPDTEVVTSDTTATAPHLAFLAKLVARDSNLGRTHLFTLNYDTLFEQGCEQLGIQYFDGFTGRADARFDPSVYGLDIYYPGEVSEGRVRRFDKFLHLYKLHGSIHWRLHNNELRARHPNLLEFRTYHNSNVSEKVEKLTQCASPIEPIGILPTANKFTQTLTMPYAHLFRALQFRLSAPQTFLLVLGYGFGDDHVTRMLETALMNPSLIMLVIEPNPGSATVSRVRRYKDLGKRAFVLSATETNHGKSPYLSANFDDFARNIMPDVQWLDDFLKLRRFEKQIQSAVIPTQFDNS